MKQMMTLKELAQLLLEADAHYTSYSEDGETSPTVEVEVVDDQLFQVSSGVSLAGKLL